MRLEYRPFYGTSDPKPPRYVIEMLVAELGPLGLGLLGALSASARLRHRGEVATGLRRLGFGRDGSLRGNGVAPALGKNLFDLGVRAGIHVD